MEHTQETDRRAEIVEALRQKWLQAEDRWERAAACGNRSEILSDKAEVAWRVYNDALR
jgi:hypothetical protein